MNEDNSGPALWKSALNCRLEYEKEINVHDKPKLKEFMTTMPGRYLRETGTDDQRQLSVSRKEEARLEQ